MRLTPADVHNVAFSKPPIGKRGYNEDEVDAFLDLVEAELARLVEENNDVRQRVQELDDQLASSQNGGGAPHDDAQTAYVPIAPQREAEQAPGSSPEVAPATEPAPAAAAAPEPTPAARPDHNVQAAKVLALAQEMADRLTGEAREESAKLSGDAKTSSEAMVADATAKSEKMLGDATAKSDQLTADARKKADAALVDARSRAETLQRQAKEKADALTADAERKHTELEKKIDELRTFEREYRTRLKTYLESQLQELGQRGSAAPTDATRGKAPTSGVLGASSASRTGQNN